MFSPFKIIKEKASDYLNKQFQITDDLQAFDQKNDIFNRAVWDKSIHPKHFFASYDIANLHPKKAKGFGHWDYAFRNAAWHLTDTVGEAKFEDEGRVEGFTDFYSIQTPPSPMQAALPSPTETSRRVKQAARMFGAGMAGICELDWRWVYSHRFNRKQQDSIEMDLPKQCRYAIMLVIPMDQQLSETIPSALGGATTGLGYAQSLLAANALAQFIVNLGYTAVASMNDTALNIPLAIQAGLGEYGRNGLLITPTYGPNVRIAKVLTDLPLAVDQPIEFGVKSFCQICRRCSDSCPVKAIAKAEPQSEPPNFSSLQGIRKWTVNAEKCFSFWVGMNTDCAICIRVCPYNKDYRKWWNRLGLKLAGGPLRTWMLWLDQKLGFGKRIAPEKWWR